MSQLSLYPRVVCFDRNGKAKSAGVACYANSDLHPCVKVMQLPSTHYDFVEFDVRGKTKTQIEQEIKELMKKAKE